MNYNEIFGILAPAISFIAFVPYFKSILQGKTKPSAASWWTWAILAFVSVGSSWAGARRGQCSSCRLGCAFRNWRWRFFP